jgi:hypothetical protein
MIIIQINNKLLNNIFMKNPIDYLWYKIYKALYIISGRKDTINDAGFMAILLIFNFLSIRWLIYGNISEKFIIWTCVLVTIIILPYFFNKKKLIILKKYRCESKESKIIGNTIVTIYIILSFIAPFIIAKLKNGYIFID